MICVDCGGPTRKRESQRCRSCVAKRKWRNGTLTPTPSSKVTLHCEVCAVAFEVIPARVGTARVCSRRCMNVIRRSITGPTHPLAKPQIELTCEQCSATFKAKPCFGPGLRYKRFCSRGCVGAWVSSNQPRISSVEVATAAYLDAIGVEYRQQVSVGRFVADFVVGDVIVEVDGDYWHSIPSVAARDIRKNAAYAAAGYQVVRLTESEVRRGDFTALEGVASWASAK